MIRFKIKVTYLDGQEVEVECGTAAVAAWERYAARHGHAHGDDSPATLSNLVIAHRALGIEQGVDAWMETVDGIDVEILRDGKPVPPTAPEPSTG